MSRHSVAQQQGQQHVFNAACAVLDRYRCTSNYGTVPRSTARVPCDTSVPATQEWSPLTGASESRPLWAPAASRFDASTCSPSLVASCACDPVKPLAYVSNTAFASRSASALFARGTCSTVACAMRSSSDRHTSTYGAKCAARTRYLPWICEHPQQIPPRHQRQELIHPRARSATREGPAVPAWPRASSPRAASLAASP